MANKEGKHYTFEKLEFWAQNGLVYWLDYRDHIPEDQRFKVECRAETFARAIMLNDDAKHIKYSDERWAWNKLVVEMCACVKEAGKQGDPMDPEAAKRVAYENRKLIFINNYNPDKFRNRVLTGYSYTPNVTPFPPDLSKMSIAGNDSAPSNITVG